MKTTSAIDDESNTLRLLVRELNGVCLAGADLSGVGEELMLAADSQPAGQKQKDMAAQLERAEPGITHVEWSPDGTIVIDDLQL